MSDAVLIIVGSLVPMFAIALALAATREQPAETIGDAYSPPSSKACRRCQPSSDSFENFW